MEAAKVLTTSQIFGGALLAGALQSVFVYGTAALFGVPLGNISLFLGSLVTADAAAALMVGRVILGVMALVWGFLFMPFARAIDAPWQVKGILYGLIVWALSTLVILPLLSSFNPVYHIARTPGTFGMGFAGWAGTSIAIAAHVVYGWVLSSRIENAAQGK